MQYLTGKVHLMESTEKDYQGTPYPSEGTSEEDPHVRISLGSRQASGNFDAMAEAGEGSDLVLQLADVFSHQVDFVNDVQEGDSFC